MLLSLHVKNFAIIDEIEVYFKDNLNILTGETGAGKSIIIGSINVALGGKVSKDIIRKGAEFAFVELAFQTDNEAIIEKVKSYDLPMEEDGLILISRKLMNNRSISKINGENVTANILKDIAGLLIDIHGQHQHQSLLYKSKHLEFLDQYAKHEVADIKEKLSSAYHEYTKLARELEEAKMDEEKRLREMSYLEYEIAEIQEAKLIPGEDVELASEFKKLANANTIAEGLDHTYQLTSYNSDTCAGNQIGRAVKQLMRLEEYDTQIESFSQQISDIESLLNDFNRQLAEYLSDLNTNKEYFEEVENRLDLINRLKAKYGNDIPSILQYCKEGMEKLEKYQDYDNYISNLEKEVKKSEVKLDQYCQQVSQIRKKYAEILVKEMKKALIDLNFLDVQLEMEFEKLDKYTSNGYDEAQFLISTNPGEEIRPLAAVASGGELSRIMLGLKSVLAHNDSIETLIFDEIDVGISGRTAQKVSEKLATIANAHQVLCITHLPQIAAMADSHFIIEKISDQITTHTTIRNLNHEESVEEIARILGGAEITETVMESAKEMKQLAAKTKKF